MSTVLVVDDERSMRRLIGDALRPRGYEVREASNGVEGLQAVRRELIDLVITDVRMPIASGFDLLRELARPDDPPVVMLSGCSDIPTAVRAMRQGAVDFFSTPIDLERLVDSVTKHCRPRPAQRSAILGSSGSIRRVIEQIEQAAKTDLTVLVTGESGTGKELAARTLHTRSLRAAGPFVAVNCSALPDGVLQSELFGHERGAFTGAHARRRGRFELADGGTIFLDEIGDASLPTQATLLRVLEEREFERVGGLETVRVNVRVVAATNRDLGRAVAEGTFREDLLYRLDVVPLRMPPLRERPEDVPELVTGLLARHSGGPAPTLTNESLLALQEHDWPGNVRQLANFLHRLCVAAGSDGRIGVDAVRRELLATTPARRAAPRLSARESFLERDREELIAALDDTRWNVSAAARRLGLSRSALRYRMEKHGLL